MAALFISLGLVACGGSPKPDLGERTTIKPPLKGPSIGRPRIVVAQKPLQCVPYARAQSGIQIRGNAHTWWQSAATRYVRTTKPKVGAVLVLRKTRRLRYGHLAVVKKIVSSRKIIVSHANWLNKGRIHLDTPAIDVSRNNDWSKIRFWYVPGQVMGSRRYAAHGFILPPKNKTNKITAMLDRPDRIN